MSKHFDEPIRGYYDFNQPSENPNYGDFTTFYAVIAICTIFGFFLFAINIVFWCSRYREYWCDSNTGNRWIIPLWTKTPHNQPPLDLTELDEAWLPEPGEYEYPDNYSDYEQPASLRSQQEEFIELVRQHKSFQKKESDL